MGFLRPISDERQRMAQDRGQRFRVARNASPTSTLRTFGEPTAFRRFCRNLTKRSDRNASEMQEAGKKQIVALRLLGAAEIVLASLDCLI
jgi:hypothetical protein